jgi:sialic acid synthase SpsE
MAGEVHGVEAFLHGLKFENFTFLECVAAYPADPEDYNLSLVKWNGGCAHDAMETIQYGGVSDHTKSEVVSLVALGLGARIFEKHFTALDLPGISTPDFPVSAGPVEMARYVRYLREGFSAIGDGHKQTRGCEKHMVLRHRRRLKVIAPIKAGEKLKLGENFGIYRSIANDVLAAAPEMVGAFQDGVAKQDLSPGDPVWHSTVEVRGE